MLEDQGVRSSRTISTSEAGSTVAAATVRQALDRLEEAIDYETDALRRNGPLDFGKLNELKSRLLLQLTRAARALPPGLRDAGLGAHTLRLRQKLEQNRDLLQTHLAAEQEIGNILAAIIRDAESDGTYSAVGGQGQDR